MSGMSGLKGLLSAIAATVLLAAGSGAHASPVFTMTGVSGLVGSNVGVKVGGDVNFFFGADLVVGFDNTQLTFVGVAPASFLTASNVIGGEALIAISPLVPGNDLGAGPNFDYFELIFSINAGASGSSALALRTGSNLYFDAVVDTYDVTGLGATVNVTVPTVNGVPIGSTAPLLLAGLGLLAFSRRRAA